MGLVEPIDTTWFNGRSVTVYPSGRVVEIGTGRVVQNACYPFDDEQFDDTQNVRVTNKYGSAPSVQQNHTALFIFGLLALVAIVAIAKR